MRQNGRHDDVDTRINFTALVYAFRRRDPLLPIRDCSQHIRLLNTHTISPRVHLATSDWRYSESRRPADVEGQTMTPRGELIILPYCQTEQKPRMLPVPLVSLNVLLCGRSGDA
jgi:hypothetical protein